MRSVTRRSLLRSAALALGAAAVLPRRARRAQAQTESRWTAIGYSQGGQPLVVYHLGDGPARVFLLGGHHGGPEANTTTLATMLHDYFAAHPHEIPPGLGVDVMPAGNPDGLVAGTRQYLSGVDPNRNWGSADWSPDAYDSNGRYRRGLGGSEPFSEQETRALADWIDRRPPALVLNFHSAGGFMFGDRAGLAGEISAIYAETSGYYWPDPGVNPNPLPYVPTGTLSAWTSQLGILDIFVELTTSYYPEFERNLVAVQAVMARLAASLPPQTPLDEPGPPAGEDPAPTATAAPEAEPTPTLSPEPPPPEPTATPTKRPLEW